MVRLLGTEGLNRERGWEHRQRRVAQRRITKEYIENPCPARVLLYKVF